MRNEKGDYTISRLMKDTGTVLEATGKTIEKARFALKNEVKKYREQVAMGLYLKPTGEKIPSPGLVQIPNRSGTISLRHDPNREAQVMARPDVARYIQRGRKDNLLDS